MHFSPHIGQHLANVEDMRPLEEALARIEDQIRNEGRVLPQQQDEEKEEEEADMQSVDLSK